MDNSIQFLRADESFPLSVYWAEQEFLQLTLTDTGGKKKKRISWDGI